MAHEHWECRRCGDAHCLAECCDPLALSECVEGGLECWDCVSQCPACQQAMEDDYQAELGLSITREG